MYLTLRHEPDAPTTAATSRRRAVPAVVVALGMVSLLTDLSSEAVASILPLYLTTTLGLSILAFGFLDGLNQGISAVVRIAAGHAADRWNNPKWVAFGGYGLSAVARAGLMLSAGATAIGAVITADRIGKGIRTAPRDAMIAASVDPATAGRAFGVHRALDTVGAALGPLLAFTVLWFIADGYREVMLVSLVAALLGLGVLLTFVPQVRTRPAHAKPAPLRDAATPALRRLLLAAGLLAVLSVGDGFLYLALNDRSDFATRWFPLLYVGTNVVFMVLAVPFGRLADAIGRRQAFVLGHLALLGAYAAAATPAPATVTIPLTLGLLGAFYAATDGVLAALAAESVPPEVRATAIGAAQTVVALGRMLASIGFGVLWYVLGPVAALLSAAVLLICALPVAASLLVPASVVRR